MCADTECSVAKPRILVVDDEQPFASLVQMMLLTAGYEVVVETNPLAAVSRAEAGERFALAVLDVVMPHLSGERLAARLRQIDRDLKVLYVTGFDEALFQARPVLWEGESYLEKPVTLEGLCEAVALALYGHITAPRGD